ncbi:hypothetical protein ABPG74_007730 [Tetrahymena malaccensis]
MLDYFKDLDIFSESIQFNANRQRLRKRTFLGAFLTVSIIVITFIYYIYLSYQYFSGQMDPKFRQQTFVSNQINIDLNNEMFGFDFFSLYSGQYLSQQEAQQNKTYFVYLAKFIITDSSNSSNIINQIIPLDIIKCQSPELQGMNCFNLSKLPNPQLIQKHSFQFFSLIKLSIYKCQDVDLDKTYVPDNCANKQEIDKLIMLSPYKFVIKTQISQFNITSNQIEHQYKSQTIINDNNIITYNEIKILNQITEVKQGFLIQTQNTFQSPLLQTLTTYTYDRNLMIQDGVACLSQVIINLDESQTYFTIQYPIYAEVLALCNSTLTILLLLGSFCRKIAQKIIRRDIFFILMKDFFLGTYLQILKHNKILDFNNQIQSNEILLNEQTVDNLTIKNQGKKKIFVPYLTPKSNKRVFEQYLSNNYSQNTEQDPVIEEMLTQTKQSDDFYESLRINQMMLTNKQASTDQQSDDLKKNSLNNLDQNKLNIINNIQQQQQNQLYQKDSKQKLTNSMLKTPRPQCRQKKISQSSQFQTQERQTNNIQKQRALFKKNEYFQSKGLKQQMIKEFEQRIDESLDYFVFYKEILLLKKAVMMILSKEQFAALQVIGIDMDQQKYNSEDSKAIKQEDNTVNHFKEQYEILQSKELQLQYISKFLKKYETILVSKNNKVELKNKQILMKVVEFIKDFDIFSENVQFNASRQRLRKRTAMGAFLTVSIITITLIYFVYQSYLYFTGQMDPKFRQQTFVSNNVSINLHNEMFGFDFFHSKEVNIQAKDIIKCQSPELQNMYCFDFSKLPNPALVLANAQQQYYYFQGRFEFFSGTYLQILEHNKIVKLNNQVQKTEIIFDEQTEEKLSKNDEDIKKSIIIPCITPKSSNIVFQQQLSNNYSQNTEQDQVIEEQGIQTKQSCDLKESLRINQKNIVNKQFSLDKSSDYQIKLNLNKSDQNEIDKAQSISRNIQQQQLFQIHLKDSNIRLTNGVSKTPKRQFRLMNMSQSNQFETQEKEIKNIKKFSEQINNRFLTLNDKSAHLQLEKILFQRQLFKQKEYLQSKGLKQQIVREVEQRIDESLDYFAFYKEILLLKKAIMMILNKEQLATLQVIGIDLEQCKEKEENQKIISQASDLHANYFKEQYDILQSKELQLQYINSFLKKCENNRQSLDNIDKRILSSMQIYEQN